MGVERTRTGDPSESRQKVAFYGEEAGVTEVASEWVAVDYTPAFTREDEGTSVTYGGGEIMATSGDRGALRYWFEASEGKAEVTGTLLLRAALFGGVAIPHLVLLAAGVLVGGTYTLPWPEHVDVRIRVGTELGPFGDGVIGEGSFALPAPHAGETSRRQIVDVTLFAGETFDEEDGVIEVRVPVGRGIALRSLSLLLTDEP